VEERLGAAEAQLAEARKTCAEVVAVLCRAEIVDAVNKAEAAGNTANRAIGVAMQLAQQRLGVQVGPNNFVFNPGRFVDAVSWELLRKAWTGRSPSWEPFFESLAVPDRGGFERELVDGPRESFEVFARIARLDEGSTELANLRRSLEKPKGKGGKDQASASRTARSKAGRKSSRRSRRGAGGSDAARARDDRPPATDPGHPRHKDRPGVVLDRHGWRAGETSGGLAAGERRRSAPAPARAGRDTLNA